MKSFTDKIGMQQTKSGYGRDLDEHFPLYQALMHLKLELKDHEEIKKEKQELTGNLKCPANSLEAALVRKCITNKRTNEVAFVGSTLACVALIILVAVTSVIAFLGAIMHSKHLMLELSCTGIALLVFLIVYLSTTYYLFGRLRNLVLVDWIAQEVHPKSPEIRNKNTSTIMFGIEFYAVEMGLEKVTFLLETCSYRPIRTSYLYASDGEHKYCIASWNR